MLCTASEDRGKNDHINRNVESGGVTVIRVFLVICILAVFV